MCLYFLIKWERERERKNWTHVKALHRLQSLSSFRAGRLCLFYTEMPSTLSRSYSVPVASDVSHFTQKPNRVKHSLIVSFFYIFIANNESSDRSESRWSSPATESPPFESARHSSGFGRFRQRPVRCRFVVVFIFVVDQSSFVDDAIEPAPRTP